MKNSKTNESRNSGITLIALIITIIVLLILAGVTIAQITGSENAMEKAQQARTENDKGAMKDAASLLATSYIQDYYDRVYVQNDSTFRTNYANAGAYAKAQFPSATEGGYTYAVSGDTLTVTDTKGNTVTGTILDNGNINWSDGTNSGGEEPVASNLSATEKTALASNGMAELTGNEITNSNLVDNDNIRAVLTGQIPVPVGYTYKEGKSTSVTKPTGGSYGVVVTDSNNNEWVWVPVNSNESVAPTALYTTNAEGYTMGDNAEKSPKLELAKNINGLKIASISELPSLKVATTSSSSVNVQSTRRSASGIIRGVDRGEWSYREPTLVTDYDLQSEYYTQAGFDTAEAMAQEFSDDYNAMIASITKYGGFYVGRYELSGKNNGSDRQITNVKVQAGQAPIDSVNWYRLYQACKTLGTGTTTSTMIWGSQWDLVCLWTENYSGLKYDEYHSNAHSGDSSATTGSNSNDIRNNICDLEGSRYEWTQEAYYSGDRALRGGNYYGNGYDVASDRSGNYPLDYYDNNGSRPSLYIE